MTVILVAEVPAIELGIITGKEKGTYYQFGLNLQELMASQNIQLNVYPSTGSVENIYAVFKKPGVQLGIVQSDVLAFVARVQSNSTLKSIAQKIKLVFPLYNEEIHLLARKGISDFNDLANRTVAIGEEGSGTYLTARLLFEVSKVKPKQMEAIGTDVALARLKEGTVDAMFYVAGSPVKLFSEDVRETDGVELIPITDAALLDFYPSVKIPAGTYAWQNKEVDTIAVKAVLVTYNFKSANCENIGRCTQIISENFDKLKANGHPKWKTVDLDYNLKGWDQYDCARKYLAQTQKTNPAQLNPVLDAIKEMLE
jgi:TRAP transporter TAXI family solute receptor